MKMVLNYPVLYKTTDSRAETAIATAVQSAVDDAKSLWAPESFDGVFPTKGYGIRRLRPRDICSNSGSIYGPSNSTWLVSIIAASTWQYFISSGVLSDSCYIVITGFFNYDTTPDIDAIKINADGIEYTICDLDEAYGWDVATAYFSHPIVVRPQKLISIRCRARTAGQKQFGLLGFTIAKRSYLITEI